MHVDSDHQQAVTFLGVPIVVGPGVLAPRAETELLARAAIGLLPQDQAAPLAIDMCCGSGNLAMALARSHPTLRVWASDLTEETTLTARTNCERLGLSDRVTVARGDMFEGIAALVRPASVDLVVCNPPYISSGKLEGESRGLLDEEPREAFDGGPYGIAILQRLVGEAHPYLKSGGWLAFEFGRDQERQAAALIKRTKAYGDTHLVNDAQGNPRVAMTQKV